MTSVQFCYWLQGFFELSEAEKLSVSQVKTIRAHLNMVFKHEIDPSYGDEKHRQELNSIHDGSKDPSKDPPLDGDVMDKLEKFIKKAAEEHKKTVALIPHYKKDNLLIRC